MHFFECNPSEHGESAHLIKYDPWTVKMWLTASDGSIGSNPTVGRNNQGCQIFLGPNIPKWEKYTK
jgi:hypothetical protein